MPARPTGRPVSVRPDWVCEILSESNAETDLVKKFRTYHANQVPHYCVVDPERQVFVVYRWADAGYVAILTAGRGDTVRAEPFAEVELRVGLMFGDE